MRGVLHICTLDMTDEPVFQKIKDLPRKSIVVGNKFSLKVAKFGNELVMGLLMSDKIRIVKLPHQLLLMTKVTYGVSAELVQYIFKSIAAMPNRLSIMEAVDEVD